MIRGIFVNPNTANANALHPRTPSTSNPIAQTEYQDFSVNLIEFTLVRINLFFFVSAGGRLGFHKPVTQAGGGEHGQRTMSP